MMFANKSPEERRKDLKTALDSGRIIQMPGAHEPIVARIIEEFNFDEDNNLLLVKGAVPGATGGSVFVRPSVKFRA